MPTSQRCGAEAPEELLAEEIYSSADEAQSDATSVTRRARGRSTTASRPSPGKPAVARRPKKVVAERVVPARRPASRTRPLRSLVILTMVGGLIATVALPAYGA